MFKRFLTCLLTFVMIISVVGCGTASKDSTNQAKQTEATKNTAESSSSDDVVRLGLYDPFTGPSSILGLSQKEGVELALEEINNAGGLLGKKVELIAYDDKSSPEQAVKNVTRLIEIDKVHGIIGSLHSGNIKASGAIVEKAKIPEIGTGIAPDWLEQGWTYLFRSLANTNYASTSLLETCKTLELNKLAVFHALDEYAKDSKDNMLRIAEEYGMEILNVESFNPGDNDFTGQMTKISNSKPDVVFIAAVQNELGSIIKQLRLNGYEGYIIGDIAMGNAEVTDIAGDATDKCIFAAQYVIPKSVEEVTDPVLKAFFEKFQKKYGKLPESDCALRAYDAAMIFIEGVKAAGSLDGTAIRDAISNINGYVGLAGKFNFVGGNGEGIKTLRTYILLDKKPIPIEDYLKMVGK
jgi:branched-chain amino acid transport system substrate-binding protein